MRINALRMASRIGLPALLDELSVRYRELRCEVTTDNRLVDIVGHSFDAGIRLKERVGKEMVRVRLTKPFHMVVVGAPRYFAKAGLPKKPSDLVAHACLGWKLASGGERRWAFAESEVAVRGSLLGDDADLLLACAAAGQGLAYVAEPEARLYVDRGLLKPVLERYALTHEGLFLYYARALRGLANMRALAECARSVSDR